MPLPDDSLSADEDQESPINPRADSEDISDVEAVADPICGSFSSLINYEPTDTPEKSACASLEPKEPEPAPTVCVFEQRVRITTDMPSVPSF